MGEPDAAVILSAAMERVIVSRCRTAAPHEACGLLLGRADQVTVALAARNVDERPTVRYAIDPADHFAAVRRARSDGLEILGIYHSHPAGDAAPSASDTAEAVASYLYVIVGLAPAPTVRAWRLHDGNFVAVRVVRR